MLIVNDNLGVIIDEDYLNSRVLFQPDGMFIDIAKILKGELPRSLLNHLIPGHYALKDRDKILKGSRKVEDIHHDKEEARLSLKIAKVNVAIDPKNKYYQQQLDLAQTKLNGFLTDELLGKI